ncbi:MAG: hypothetical protein GY927_15750 [bacterium]|nr:hypothetical protein [bacterium]
MNKSRAAKAVGISRTTLDKDIELSKISTEKDGRNRVVIDVSELQRTYGKVDIDGVSNTVYTGQNNAKKTMSYDAVVQVKDELIEHLKTELEQERRRTEDMQNRLDESERERRQKDGALTALLTDQRDRSSEVDRLKAELETERGRGWWSRLLGR